jgi:hypothetical protein
MLRLLDWANWALTVLGLVVVAWGAFVAARAVILDEPTARRLAGTYWDMNEAMMTALLRQSRAAKRGLYLVAVGSFMQVGAVALQVLRSLLTD